MLRQVFPRGYPLYEQSRFAQDLEEFNAWLVSVGYSRTCVRGHLFRLKRSLERIRRAKPGSLYTAPQLDKAFGADCTAPKRTTLYRATQHAYQRFLLSQGRLRSAAVKVPFAQLRQDYRQYLRELRGLVCETIEQHDRTVADFLHRFLPSGRNLGDLTHAHVEQYLALISKGISRHRLQHIVAHLRAFLRYCHDRNEIRLPLHVIDTPRIYHDELPPRALDWSLVKALLRSIDRSSKSGWRDYTILHLLAHYGLRPCEVICLRAGSIDWSNKTLYVEQHKTHSTLVLPLAEQTLSILRRYLALAPSQSYDTALFLRARCPTNPISRHAVGDIFDKRAKQSGLPIGGHSVYSLRHAFAMRLLGRGVGLKAIGDLLGHRSLDSTRVYLRLDINMLRDVALPVPTQVQR
jgi:integrase/recombinase XerD